MEDNVDLYVFERVIPLTGMLEDLFPNREFKIVHLREEESKKWKWEIFFDEESIMTADRYYHNTPLYEGEELLTMSELAALEALKRSLSLFEEALTRISTSIYGALMALAAEIVKQGEQQ